MKPPKRRRVKVEEGTESKRTNTKIFFLCDKKVCQSFFLKTLAISNGPLNNAFKHKSSFANFFDGCDQRGRHPPSNKLKEEIVVSIVNWLHEKCICTESSGKYRKKIICDVDYRSLRVLYNTYKSIHTDDGLCPSYTSFKKIFYENDFSFPNERLRQKPLKTEKVEVMSHEIINVTENAVNEEKFVVNQVGESYEEQGTEVYEIQFVAL